MANSTIRVIGGNFITARRSVCIDGVDMQYAGAVRKVDAEGIRAQLGLGNIVLLSCMGTSPTGESLQSGHGRSRRGDGGGHECRQARLSFRQPGGDRYRPAACSMS
jgi:hypothetical protein